MECRTGTTRSPKPWPSWRSPWGSSPRLPPTRAPLTTAPAWAQAARSYLTQNRTKGPEDQVFRTACQLEGTDKDKARIEAILVGVKSLMKVDKNGCRRFLESYVEAKESDKICDAAGGNDDETTRRLLKDNVPPRKSKK